MSTTVDEPVNPSIAHVIEQARLRAGGAAEVFIEFVERYFRETDSIDLRERAAEDLFGVADSHWQLAARRPPGETMVQVSNPDIESTGWRSPHTVVLIVTDDLPFLVDSVRMLMARHGLGTHLMVHPMLTVHRDDAGEVVSFPGRGGVIEAWTMLEVDRCDAATGRVLERELRHVLDDIRTAVTDWDEMRTRTVELAKDLDAPSDEGLARHASATPVAKLLNWLTRRHFVFFGMAQYEVTEVGIRMVKGSQLGLMRRSHRIDPELATHNRLLSVSRSQARSLIHRDARLTCIAVRRFSSTGEVIGEDRILGLFAAAAYRETVIETPYLRDRAERVLEGAGFPAEGHSGRELRSVLESFPRDDLFEIDPDELFSVAVGIAGMQERRRVRVFRYSEPTGRYVNVLVYLPRDRFTEGVGDEVVRAVATAHGGVIAEHDTSVGASSLARLHVVVKRVDNEPFPALSELEALIDQLTTTWPDRLSAELLNAVGEHEAHLLLAALGDAIPPDYQAVTDPRAAVADLRRVHSLRAVVNNSSANGIATALQHRLGDPAGDLRFKLYRRGEPVMLSAVLPLLEHLGLSVIDEHPFELRTAEGSAWIYDIGVRLPGGLAPSDAVRTEAEATFAALFRGDIEPDGFNRLVLAAGLTGRQVAVLRSYAKYLRQTGFPYLQSTIEAMLVKHSGFAVKLAALFERRFDPAARAAEDRDAHASAIRAELVAQLDEIPSLDEDRIGRALLALIDATLRTNAFRPDGDRDGGNHRPVLAFKFDPTKVPDLPLPRPMFEIFVCSPRVEGVHLRGGRIARGGLRWSDRHSDFRTEVLGLMKAQMVKNAVIVPVGAKGGFVVKQPPADGEALRAEVVACYQQFVRGLLDLTDNYVAGMVVPPPSTVRYDDDDPYLVVAADKGTATFSDIANQISLDYRFWLGDAFASGGSVGYDHKAMGITARGAWESVRRHARVLGKDADRDELRVIGIGDMSGDVFGNGLLSSPHLKLVAAFDHRHIFIDPAPDPALSFAERKRLFELPRSSWTDYDKSLISEGGGVWPRTAKIIELSPQVRSALAIDAAALTPLELLTAILRAPLDLLWNGGIGTYVKASSETHTEVGDRANDGLRINGSDLRCKMVGEGGNLGFTQRGRVEYALGGGLINTDAIDNSAGVDCSDHEVNIKILLNELVAAGDMTVKQRNEILATMTDEVGELVLDDNRAQTLALAIARQQAASMVNVHTRYIHQLEVEGWMNRQLEHLPTDKQLAERQSAGQGLTTPEFAVLLAYTKLANIAELDATTNVALEPYLEADLVRYFPKRIQAEFAEAIRSYRLRDDVILTQVVNQMVNLSGISFDHRMTEETGATPGDVVLAWVAARDIFGYVEMWDSIEALGSSVSMATQLELFLEARRMIERSVMWLLRHRRPPLDIAATVEAFRDDIQMLLRQLTPFVRGPLAKQTEALAAARIVAGVPGGLAEASAIWPLIHTSFDVIELAKAHSLEPQVGAAAYWELVEHLDVTWLWNAIGALPRADRWQTHARAAVRDDLLSALADLTGDVLAHGGAAATWAAANERAITRAQAVFAEIRRTGVLDLTTLSVALRQLRNLVLSTARAADSERGQPAAKLSTRSGSPGL